VHETEPGAVRIGRRHVVSAEMSHEIGVSDVTRRLVDFADALKWYDVDRYDIVAMKTLLLLSPGSMITVVLSLWLCMSDSWHLCSYESVDGFPG